MIPSILAQQVKQGVEDFLKTTFPVSTPFFRGMLERMLEADGEVFKGPYLSIRLPYRKGVGGRDFFPDVPLRFKPYLHQEQAFNRLAGPDARSAIVATGTGSGKTECYLYPILDHCYQHRGEPGVKAILIYPMNALASDQAERIAKTIYANPKLRGAVTAGLFVGQRERDPHSVMSAESVISDKETMRLRPPDILLTNYKMLDYLLIRPKDSPLWAQNNPETLKYLVVDELHTFDGAQGTDLACLLRRLKARLDTPKEHLCCVGTSATLGTESERSELLDYCRTVFGEPFDEDAIIEESTLDVDEFLRGDVRSFHEIVPPARAEALNPYAYAGYEEYTRAQHELWFGEAIPESEFAGAEWRVQLSDRLKGHRLLRNILTVLDGRTKSFGEILDWLASAYVGFAGSDPEYRRNLLNSFLTLLSEARVWRVADDDQETAPAQEGLPGFLGPLLNIRVQYWLREMRRMVCEVSEPPNLRFADDLTDERLTNHLPVVHCRECGGMGWAGTKPQHESKINPDLRTFYIAFFAFSPNVVFLFPEDGDRARGGPDGEYFLICSTCLHLTQSEDLEKCPSCGADALIPIFRPNTKVKIKDRFVGVHNCPYCESANSLTILGSRAASLGSVVISQLYSSNFNNDKKLLTFSDSVQDAAHRAGFFASRTYRFNFRTALQKFVREESAGVSLSNLPAGFIEYWSKRMDLNTYIATFLAPGMEWMPDYNYLTDDGRLPDGSRLKEEVDGRVGWEIYSEYGFNARIGRTLEKTGSSILGFDRDKADAVVEKLLEPMRNEIGPLRALDELTLKRFLLGVLVHLKNQGGVFHPALEAYIQEKGNSFKIGKQHQFRWMPYFGKRSRLPVFLCNWGGGRFDSLLSAAPKNRTWYQDWAEKCFIPIAPLMPESIPDIYKLTLKHLEDAGLLGTRSVKGRTVWGLNAESLSVGCETEQLRCRTCGHNLSVAAPERDVWNGAACQRFRCDGTYDLLPQAPDYYRELYATGDVQRIFAKEHTGLLHRDAREELEKRFKSRDPDRKPWDPNLLSCTPTLEMGIDIGDLSTLVLCSVPPTQANYLQRIGRSGRADGNALNLTMANARPHDLYFFAEPEEMLAGRVDAPGIFLNASAVLERQLTAFCFDCWVKTGISENAIPDYLGGALGKLQPVDNKVFPHNFLWFVSNNRTDLVDRFLSLFDNQISDESEKRIKEFAEGDANREGSLEYKISDGLYRRKTEMESLRKKVRLLTSRIRAKEKETARSKSYEEDLADLKREKEGLQAVVKQIRDRNIFNFFTDEGLIPNYAFPEAGVTLRSVIYRPKERAGEGESKYYTWTEEYQRSAGSAIDELAPENRFYAGGRRVEIDQVHVDVSHIEEWRLCDNCSYSERIGQHEEKTVCLRCGSPMWADEGRKKPMVRMKQVFATSSDRRSRIADDSDDREPKFFNKQLLVDVQDEHIGSAYRIADDELPFGFEFLSKAVFREINFGEKGEGGQTIKVAGVDLPRKGFVICRHCGKVQKSEDKPQHALTCTSRNQESDANFTHCVYLYRDFSSEAIRILLPVTTFSGSDRKFHSFVAALQLGLKLYFRGRIDHLQTTEFEEPDPESGVRRKYLLLYDVVPGGTGYLKELMQSQEQLLRVIEIARDALASCSCVQDGEKDGCYRCLFAYRSSYNMESTSRTTALELLTEILRHKERFVPVENLKRIQIDALIDSELEARFLEALRRLRHDGYEVTLRKESVNNRPGYFLRINERSYYISPQVDLGERDGVSIPGRADFVFYPARPGDAKPIVVFTDGFFYHKKRVGKDLAQRMAIARSGKFHVWSLTWKDVENRFQSQGAYFRNFTDPAVTPGGSALTQMLEVCGLSEFKRMHGDDSFQWFVKFLSQPDDGAWSRYALLLASTLVQPALCDRQEVGSAWQTSEMDRICDGLEDFMGGADDQMLYGLLEHTEDASGPWRRTFVAVKPEAVREIDVRGVLIVSELNDSERYRGKPSFEQIWNGFLRDYNLFQFLPHATFVTSHGIADRAYIRIFDRPAMPAAVAEEPEAAEWLEMKELTDPEIHGLLDVLARSGAQVPELGFELTDEDGIVRATAELGWLDLKLAFLEGGQMVDVSAFEKAGWRAIPLREVVAAPDTYLPIFNSPKDGSL